MPEWNVNKIRELIRIYLSDGYGHQAKEIIDYIQNRVNISKREIEYQFTYMVENNQIKRKKPKGSSYSQYFLKIEDVKKTTTHRLYLIGKKGHMFFWQDEITNTIQRNWNRYISTEKKDIRRNSSLITNTLINFLWFHQKLLFGELSYWFGDSKSELIKAKKNRLLLEEHIQEIFTDVIKEDSRTWHSMIHSIHDIIDEHRILSKSQIKKLWNA